MTLDPPSAVAAAKCLAARLWTLGSSPSVFHPRSCAWEDYTTSDLVRLVTEHNDAVGYDERTDRYQSVPVERFRALARDHQARLVRAAQYPDDIAKGAA